MYRRFLKDNDYSRIISKEALDQMTLEHTGNQLTSTQQNAEKVLKNAFQQFISSYKGNDNQYEYNHNGAMVVDNHKGIAITYNNLNLPMQISVNNDHAQGENKYMYTATGVKLRIDRKKYSTLQSSPLQSTTNFLGELLDESRTDYVGNFIYEDNNLKRILVDNGYIEDKNYYFYVKDHLGNNRIVADANGTVVQSNEYYPFGGLMASSTNSDKQPYKFGGKELDDNNSLNLYDFSARYQDPMIPTFTTIDPHAENYYSWSPYAYVANNPLKFIDPTGMDWFVNNENGYLYFIKGISTLTDEIRSKYDLGDAKYENLGQDGDFGYGIELGPDKNGKMFGEGMLETATGKNLRGKLHEQEFVALGVYSEDFMLRYDFAKADRVNIKTTRNTEYSTDRSTHVNEKREITLGPETTYVKSSMLNTTQNIDPGKIKYTPFGNTITYEDQRILPWGHSQGIQDSYAPAKAKGDKADYKSLAIELFKKIIKRK